MDLNKAKRRFTEIANKTGIHGENLKQEPNMQERDELWDITRVFLNRIYIDLYHIIYFLFIKK